MNFFQEPTIQQAGFAFLTVFLVLSIVALALLIRDKRVEVAQVKRARAIAAHPAGKARPPVHTGWLEERPLPVEPTRHIDRAGFDWTK